MLQQLKCDICQQSYDHLVLCVVVDRNFFGLSVKRNIQVCEVDFKKLFPTVGK